MKTTPNSFLKKIIFALFILLTGFESTAAIFIVDNNADTDNLAAYTAGDGTNSLRKCLRLSNALAGADNINFNIPGVGPFTITLTGDLPAITQPVTINGLSQPGASAGTLMIEVNGAAAGNSLLFDNGSANSSLIGLVVNRSNRGVYIVNTSAITVQACYIGTDITGTIARPCNWNGIQVDNAPDVIIGGTLGINTRNVISGNNEVGLRVDNSARILINGNYFGVNATGLAALPNNWYGIQLVNNCPNSVIGNGLAGGGNVSSGHGRDGININNSTGVTIKGNIVGLGVNGSTLIPNSESGIRLGGGSNAALIGGTTLLERNIVSGNLNAGIFITQSTDPVLYGNFVGTDLTGTIDLGNAQSGILINNLSNNPIVGGALAGQGNLISGNNETGLNINSCASPVVKGNIIGLTSAANALLSNTNNGMIIENSSNPIIGGGASLLERNIVSGNGQAGMLIIASVSPTIRGNIVGTDLTGLVDFGNTGNGIQLVNACADPLIGGAIAGQGNLISGNGGSGLVVDNCLRPVIKGNVIGLGADGSTQIANNGAGIALFTGCNNAIIGGTTLPEKNLVAGNGQLGIHVNGSTNPTIYGNYIGTDISGLLDRGNGETGLFINNGSTNALIGSAAAGTGNLISGNNQRGLFVLNSANPSIKGNIIGLGIDGTTILGNTEGGIFVENSASPIIGGTTLPERNLVSSNGGTGITFINSTNGLIKANYIGVDITGMLPRGNGNAGIQILVNSNFTIIGGPSLTEGNIISNHTWAGITIDNSTDVTIKSNVVGLASDITTAAPNQQGGIGAYVNSHRLTLGGTLVSERNYISSNTGNGVTINSSNNATIVNNYLGTEVTGLISRPNTGNGVSIENAQNVTVGGTTASARNILSANGSNGLRANQSRDILVKANYMGVGADGVTPLGNWDNGIYLGDSSNQAIIGGPTAIEKNVLSGNGRSGVGDGFRSESSSRHLILGNYCGVDVSGTTIIGNSWAGISLNESPNCTVGGTGAFDGNICSGNLNEGVYFRNATYTKFIGNYVGTDKSGTLSLGNEDFGINIRAVSTNNIIGGSLAEANVIAHQQNIAGSGPGVFVEGASQFNTITYNKIYCNAGKGIELNGTANESIAKPIILTSTTNTISGSGAIDGDVIHVYLNNTTGTGCDCEGELFIGTAVVSGGLWTLTHGLGLSVAATGNLTATETTAGGSTSEFADCLVPLPVSLLEFKATKLNEHASILEWKTVFEKNNDYFEVERSSDGIHFETIGFVQGADNSSNLLSYSFVDENPFPGMNYYRLKQVDFDNRSEYSVVKNVNFGDANLSFFQDGTGYYILSNFETPTTVSYELYSTEGKMIKEGKYETTFSKTALLIPGLSSSIYYLKVTGGEILLSEKLFVK